MFFENIDPEKYVQEHGMKQESDEETLRAVAFEVIANNQKIVEDYRGGKDKAMGALVGQMMKATKGKANPAVVNKILREMV